MSEKKTKDALKEWYYKNLRNILSNVRYQVLSPFVFLIVAFLAFIYIFPIVVQLPFFEWIVNRVLVMILFIIPILLSWFYWRRSFNQISYALLLCRTIYKVRQEIKKELMLNVRLRKVRKKNKDSYSLQIGINSIRIELKAYVNSSEILTPFMPNYELDRLQRSMDTFFNSAGRILFPNPSTFSRGQEIEEQQTLDYYESQEHPTKEEIEEEFEEMQKSERGEIDWFNFSALDEFLNYLGNILFAPTIPYLPLSSRYPINLISLSGFFKHWNSKIASCRNSKLEYEETKKMLKNTIKK